MYEIKLKGTQSKGTVDPLRLYQKWVPMQEIHSKKEEEEEACYLFLLYRNELQPVFLFLYMLKWIYDHWLWSKNTFCYKILYTKTLFFKWMNTNTFIWNIYFYYMCIFCGTSSVNLCWPWLQINVLHFSNCVCDASFPVMNIYVEFYIQITQPNQDVYAIGKK